MAVPASCYDLRLSLATEEEVRAAKRVFHGLCSRCSGLTLTHFAPLLFCLASLAPPQSTVEVSAKPPAKPTEIRHKRRRSYVRADSRFAWRLDVTEVQSQKTASTTYEVEVEMSKAHTKQLAEASEAQAGTLIKVLAAQLKWAVQHLAPVESDLEVADFLEVRRRV